MDLVVVIPGTIIMIHFEGIPKVDISFAIAGSINAVLGVYVIWLDTLLDGTMTLQEWASWSETYLKVLDALVVALHEKKVAGAVLGWIGERQAAEMRSMAFVQQCSSLLARAHTVACASDSPAVK